MVRGNLSGFNPELSKMDSDMEKLGMLTKL